MRVIVAVGALAMLASAQTVARISAEPVLMPAEVAQLEATVRANPGDTATRLRLLRYYFDAAPAAGRAAFQNDRLQHILYWIEAKPADPIAASDLMYVPAKSGAFADPVDHAAARDAWMRAIDRSRNDADVVLNATRFLCREYPDEAEQLLTRRVEQNATDRRIAVNLGFLYALEILRGGASGQRAQAELERTRNALVLAGAGVALPNLVHRTSPTRAPNGIEDIFALASKFMARARELAPQAPDLQGPMPLIREFQDFQNRETGMLASPASASEPSSASGQTIRVDAAVQAAKLMEKREPEYPPAAKEMRIQGRVIFEVFISPEGLVENMRLLSGHPVFVQAATEAVRSYRYQPTLLNGSPVSVITQAEVSFLFNPKP